MNVKLGMGFVAGAAVQVFWSLVPVTVEVMVPHAVADPPTDPLPPILYFVLLGSSAQPGDDDDAFALPSTRAPLHIEMP